MDSDVKTSKQRRLLALSISPCMHSGGMYHTLENSIMDDRARAKIKGDVSLTDMNSHARATDDHGCMMASWCDEDRSEEEGDGSKSMHACVPAPASAADLRTVMGTISGGAASARLRLLVLRLRLPPPRSPLLLLLMVVFVSSAAASAQQLPTTRTTTRTATTRRSGLRQGLLLVIVTTPPASPMDGSDPPPSSSSCPGDARTLAASANKATKH